MGYLEDEKEEQMIFLWITPYYYLIMLKLQQQLILTLFDFEGK